jgi:hypothetical protein
MGSSFARLLLISAVAASCAALGGCTLVGAGIGSAVPRYERTTNRTRPIDLGEEIRVVLLRSPSASDILPRDGGGHVDGRYAGIHEGLLAVTIDGRVEPREIPLTDVDEVRVRDGSYWLTGLIVGGSVDATLIVLAAVAASQSHEMQIDVGFR